MELYNCSIYYVSAMVLISIITKHFWTNRKLYIAILKCDGPLGSSIYLPLYFAFTSSTNVIRTFIVEFRQYKGPICFWAALKPLIFLCTPEDFQTALTDPRCLEKGDMYKLAPVDSLGTVPVEKWRKRRKLVNPSFNQRFLISFMKVFNERSRACALECEKYVGDRNFEIACTLGLYLTKVICDTQLSVPPGMDVELIEKIERIMYICSKRFLKPLYLLDFIFNSSSIGKEYNKIHADITGNIRNIIAEKRKAMNENTDDNQGRTSKIRTIIDTLMDSPEAMATFTDEDLVDFIYEILFGGVDTSRLTLSGTLMMISMHPEVQEKLVKELDGIFGNEDRDVTIDDIKQAEYLDRVVKESLRVCPVNSFLGRKTLDEVKFQTFSIPAGVNLGLNVLDMHRNPDYWEDPFTYNPDRFLPEEVAKRHPYCFLPFSLGPRNCVGYIFGLLTIKTFVINILRKYRLTNYKYKHFKEVKFEWRAVLHVLNGYGILLEKRNKNHTI